jgi:hypothetical protein
MTDIPTISVATTQEGALTYLVTSPPSALPPVHGRDLAAAWDAAREAARDAAWGAARLFRFRLPDGSFTELALADRDARCWADAVDHTVGMSTSYGMSLCLRLLALVDLLARAPWAAGLLAFDAGLAVLHPALLRLAANAPLSTDARFDEAQFRNSLARPAIAAGASGASS